MFPQDALPVRGLGLTGLPAISGRRSVSDATKRDSSERAACVWSLPHLPADQDSWRVHP